MLAVCSDTAPPVLLPVSNTRFMAAVIERHTHSPERRRRYWGRSGTESDHGNTHAHAHAHTHTHAYVKAYNILHTLQICYT